MEQTGAEPKNKQKKIILISVAAVVVLIAAVIIAVVMIRNASVRRYARQIDLGNRYLSELQYDEAIAAFEAAISIDPKREEAYGGLVVLYGEQEDFEQVAATYTNASKILPQDALERLETTVESTTLAYADALVQDGNVQEAERVLALVLEATGSESLKEKTGALMGEVIREAMVWERALYDLIMTISFNDVYDALDHGFSVEPLRADFALRDIDRSPDGIPELILFDMESVTLDTVTRIYCFRDGVYQDIFAVPYSVWEGHAGSDNGDCPGLFISGWDGGGKWTEYLTINDAGEAEEESVVYLEYRQDGAGNAALHERYRTSDDALYRAYQDTENDDDSVMPLYTREEIREMGWEAFLETYGFSSYLFSEYAYLADEVKDRPEGGPVREEDLTEEILEEIEFFATGLYLGLPEDSYESADAIMDALREEPAGMGELLETYYLSLHGLNSYFDSQHSAYCYDVPDAEADGLLQSLLGTTYDFSLLPAEIRDGEYEGAYHRNGTLTVWIWMSTRSYHHTEFAGHVDTATGTDLTYIRYGYDPMEEWDGDEPNYYETGRYILHLQSFPNRYGFTITGCELIRNNNR